MPLEEVSVPQTTILLSLCTASPKGGTWVPKEMVATPLVPKPVSAEPLALNRANE